MEKKREIEDAEDTKALSVSFVLKENERECTRLSRVSNWVKMGNASLLGGNTQEPNEKGVIEHKQGNANAFKS